MKVTYFFPGPFEADVVCDQVNRTVTVTSKYAARKGKKCLPVGILATGDAGAERRALCAINSATGVPEIIVAELDGGTAAFDKIATVEEAADADSEPRPTSDDNEPDSSGHPEIRTPGRS